MRQKFLFIPLLAICFSLISATCIPVIDIKPAEDSTVKASTTIKPTTTAKVKKMSFFQRLALKIAMHKLKKHHYKIDDVTKADKMANASLWMGALALLFVLIPWYTVLLSIPLGILAIIFGSNAKKSGTRKTSKANIGKGLGFAALIVFAVFLIAALIWITAWTSW